jgi:hypothetical protein
MITRQATTRRTKIPDGIPDYQYVITGEAKAKANLPRREKIGILTILTGKFQSLEKQQVTQESCYSRILNLLSQQILIGREFPSRYNAVTYLVTL